MQQHWTFNFYNILIFINQIYFYFKFITFIVVIISQIKCRMAKITSLKPNKNRINGSQFNCFFLKLRREMYIGFEIILPDEWELLINIFKTTPHTITLLSGCIVLIIKLRKWTIVKSTFSTHEQLFLEEIFSLYGFKSEVKPFIVVSVWV